MSAGPADRCPREQQVDAYFAGRLPAARHGELRPHLGSCTACRARYHQQLQLAALDPAALPFEERMARGLGIRARGSRLPAVGWSVMVVTLALSALMLVVQVRTDSTDRFTARGGGLPAALVLSPGTPATDVLVFRTGEGRGAGLLTEPLPRDAELAFAYRNGGGWQRLLVFGRDPAGSVYWYQPPWTDEGQDPEGVPLSNAPGLHELPRAVSHNLPTGRFTLCALVTNQAISVKQLEEQLRRFRSIDGAIACRDLKVGP
jgi:hypothetical protein